jgi:tellurite resistance protein TerC
VLKRARRVVIAVIGGTVLLAGGAMIVLPGPAVIVIPVGLAILATEFVWARRLLERVRARVRRAAAPDAPAGSTRDSKERRDSTSSRP